MSGRSNKLQKVVNLGGKESQRPRRSTGPNLLPGSIVANRRQEYMNTDKDRQANQGEQANSQEKDIQYFCLAPGNQHGGHSLSAVGTLAKHH